jgi:eukaryotic-like serine/threonine-protein kinase
VIPLVSGTREGPYELLALVAAGGMGEVWKARDTRLDRIVALKFSTTTFGQCFESEARAISALNHPHICQLYDIGPNYLVRWSRSSNTRRWPSARRRIRKPACNR